MANLYVHVGISELSKFSLGGAFRRQCSGRGWA